MFCSGSPVTSANTVRIAWGAWVVIQMVNRPETESMWAMQPQVSIDETWIRGM